MGFWGWVFTIIGIVIALSALANFFDWVEFRVRNIRLRWFFLLWLLVVLSLFVALMWHDPNLP